MKIECSVLNIEYSFLFPLKHRKNPRKEKPK